MGTYKTHAMMKIAKCYRELRLPEKYIESVVSLLENVENLSDLELQYYSKELFTREKFNAVGVMKELNSALFDVKILSQKTIPVNEKGILELKIQFTNLIPLAMKFESVVLKLVGGENADLEFKTENVDIIQGNNIILLNNEVLLVL
jgi:hypothetical protein